MQRLLHSSKFWTAAIDAILSTILLLATRFLSPDDVKLIEQLIIVYQPVFIVVIAAIAVEDAAVKRAATSTMVNNSKAAQELPKSLTAKLLILLFALALGSYFFFVPQIASAEAPQPYLYAMPRCSGLSITQLQDAQQDFDSAYGWQHQLTTPAQWSASYEARANEFAHALGCPAPLCDGALAFAYKIYAPTYQRIWTLFPD